MEIVALLGVLFLVYLSFAVSASAGLGGSLVLVPTLVVFLGSKEGIALAALASNRKPAHSASVYWNIESRNVMTSPSVRLARGVKIALAGRQRESDCRLARYRDLVYCSRCLYYGF